MCVSIGQTYSSRTALEIRKQRLCVRIKWAGRIKRNAKLRRRVNWGFIKTERKFIVKYRLCLQIGLEDNEEGFGNALGFVLNIQIPVCLRDWKDSQRRSVWDIMYQVLEARLTIHVKFYIAVGALETVALGRLWLSWEGPCAAGALPRTLEHWLRVTSPEPEKATWQTLLGSGEEL